jgi:hypothetical protein
MCPRPELFAMGGMRQTRDRAVRNYFAIVPPLELDQCARRPICDHSVVRKETHLKASA